MTTKRTRRARGRRAEIPPDLLAFLKDAPPTTEIKYFTDETTIRAAWNECRDSILADWIADAPGTRPSFWWRFDAPRLPLGTFDGCYYDGKLPAPRERLGGVGTPGLEVFNIVPSYSYGIPNSWLTQEEVAYYQPGFDGIAIDPEDPPQYESQANYLQRLGLLLPGESKRLRKADFEPETVMPENDEEAEDAA